ncbi:MAG TPA: ABC transporter substrate-binding protein [Sporichthya sp.]|nr:ABC transporter substrate-binding protein [Sporichthya sp.]
MTDRRIGRSLVALTATVALLAGCGGSAVTDAADPASAQVDRAASAADVPPGATAPGSAPAATAPATSTAAAATASGSATGGVRTGVATSGAKAGKDKTVAGAAASSPGNATSTVEKVVATAPIFGGNGTCKPATLSPVNIGNVSTLSGVLGELFAPVRSALETFAASQNACGGLNGHRINLYIDDDQGDPATASSKVQAMIQTKKVLAFIGNIQLLTVDAVVPIIKKYGIPILGSDLTNNTWFTNPLLFPQGSSVQSMAYGYVQAALNYFHTPNVGEVWCIEVPRACEQMDRAFKELAPMMGATVKKTIQVSITAPSYVQQCLDLKNAGVEALGLSFDAASQHRLARSCTQVGYFPHVMPYPLGVGNEKQFLQGQKWLGNAYVSMNHFPWFASDTPALKYWQASVQKFNPGFTSGGTAAMGWASGALLVAASAGLSAENPTTQQLLDTLWTFKGQKWTTLGGLTPPLRYQENGNPRIPYCLFTAISNADNTGWVKGVSTPVCTDLVAPSDPQAQPAKP